MGEDDVDILTFFDLPDPPRTKRLKTCCVEVANSAIAEGIAMDDIEGWESGLAPGGIKMWAEYLAAKREAADLEARSAQLLCERNNILEECIGYVERINMLESGLTEAQGEAVRLRECIGDKNACIARLRADYAELEAYGRARILAHQSACEEYEAMLARFTADPMPADLPDPPRRADGTLAPQGKPFPALKAQDPSRRVGG